MSVVLCLFLVDFGEDSDFYDDFFDDWPTLENFDWRWEYQTEILDYPLQTLLGSKEEFAAWREDFRARILPYFIDVSLPDPREVILEEPEQRDGYSLQEVRFVFPQGALDKGSDLTGLLALPETIDPAKPLIIYIHGHEIEPWEGPPYPLYDDHSCAEQFARAGYVVWTPPHLFYESLASLYTKHDFHVVWTRVESMLLDAVLPHVPEHRGMAVSGTSSGGITAAFTMALRPDINVGVFAGCLISLDFQRENYRYAGHPMQWDMSMLLSYLPLYSLMAPRPAQWQMGEQDESFFPGIGPLPGRKRFPGLPRRVMANEVAGEYLILKEIWGKWNATVSLHIHPGGHEFDYTEGERFISASLSGAE